MGVYTQQAASGPTEFRSVAVVAANIRGGTPLLNNVVLTVPGGRMVRLVKFGNQDPQGLPLQFVNAVTGSDDAYVAQEGFSSEAVMDQNYPSGVYKLAANFDGAQPVSTTFTFVDSPSVAPTTITNFDELQNWPPSSARPQFSPIQGATATDQLSVFAWAQAPQSSWQTVVKADPNAPSSGGVVFFGPFPSPLFNTVVPGTSTAVTMSWIFQNQTVGVDLEYTKLVASSVANGGTTTVSSWRGFAVDFIIHGFTPAPTKAIVSSSQVVPLGSAKNLVLSTDGQSTTTQWKKDGVAIVGATSQSLLLSPVAVSDAGSYSAVIRNSNGSVESAPVTVAVSAALDVATVQVHDSQNGSVGGSPSSPIVRPLGGLATDATGRVFVADFNAVRRISPDGTIDTLAGVVGQSGIVDGTGSEARFLGPSGIATDLSGNIFVADITCIRKVTASGLVLTIAGRPNTSMSMDGPAAVATFSQATAIAVDSRDNIYVVDSSNVRKITPTGNVTTVAVDVTGLAVDGKDNVYMATYDHTIRRMSPSGDFTTMAGGAPGYLPADGLGAQACFGLPTKIACDAEGALYVVDVAGFVAIRKVNSDGMVTTVAGGSYFKDKPVDGLGIAAGFLTPSGIAVDSAGAVWIAEPNTICKATLVPGSTDPGITLSTPPRSLGAPTGTSVVFSVAASGPSIYYQWKKDGVPIPSAMSPQLLVPQIQAKDLGSYTVSVVNAVGSVTSLPALISFAAPSSTSRISNLSVRSTTGAGAQALAVGVVVGGGSSTTAKPLLIRGIGPSLTGFGVTGALASPTLTVYAGSKVLASNAGWGGTSTLSSAFAASGAFGLSPSSADAAVLTSLLPGAYTAQVAGASGTTGVALAEVYDTTPGAPFDALSPRLINLSARTGVGTGQNVLIAGFSIVGTSPKAVLIRGAGPSLTQFGVTGAITDTTLEVHAGQQIVAVNQHWGGDTVLADSFARVGAFSFPATSNDSALLLMLAPGNYSAVLSGPNGTTGTGLVEVYELP